MTERYLCVKEYTLGTKDPTFKVGLIYEVKHVEGFNWYKSILMPSLFLKIHFKKL